MTTTDRFIVFSSSVGAAAVGWIIGYGLCLWWGWT
jgi:hypothetical protein